MGVYAKNKFNKGKSMHADLNIQKSKSYFKNAHLSQSSSMLLNARSI